MTWMPGALLRCEFNVLRRDSTGFLQYALTFVPRINDFIILQAFIAKPTLVPSIPQLHDNFLCPACVLAGVSTQW